MERELFVYVDMPGQAVLAGRLWTRARQRAESATFLYDTGWLEHPDRFPLEPALPLGAAPCHTSPGRALFGSLGDSAPDRWGRALMRRQRRRERASDGTATVSLSEADFLLQKWTPLVGQGSRFRKMSSVMIMESPERIGNEMERRNHPAVDRRRMDMRGTTEQFQITLDQVQVASFPLAVPIRGQALASTSSPSARVAAPRA